MQTIYDFAGSTDMWLTLVGDHFINVVNLTGFTVLGVQLQPRLCQQSTGKELVNNLE
jgi:hypothetical protein